MSKLIERLKTVRHFDELNASEKEELKNSSVGFKQLPKEVIANVSGGGEIMAEYFFDCPTCGGKVFIFGEVDDDDPMYFSGVMVICMSCGRIFIQEGEKIGNL